MKKRLLNNLLLLFTLSFLSVAAPALAVQPAFLILSDGIDLSTEVERLENQGARVRSTVPPKILITDLPDSMRGKNIATAQTVYYTAVPLSTLEPLGPVAVAAGMQWNRRMVSEAKSSGKQSFGAMRSQVAQKSLPAPMGVAANVSNDLIHVSWQAAGASIVYEIEASLTPNFSTRFSHTHVNALAVDLPLPIDITPVPVYVRVRGIDHGDGTHTSADDVMGAWSQTVSLTVNPTTDDNTATVPVPTSPLPDFKSEGFTVILEWNPGPAVTRVQVSRSSNFSDTVFDAVVQGTEFVCPSPAMHVGDKLYWRLRSWGPTKSVWSQPRVLTIGEPHHVETDVFLNPEAPQ